MLPTPRNETLAGGGRNKRGNVASGNVGTGRRRGRRRHGDGERSGNGRMVLALTRAGVGANADRRVGGLWRGLAAFGSPEITRIHGDQGIERDGRRLPSFSPRAAIDDPR